MLGCRISGVAMALPDIIIAIRQLYSASEIVTRLLGQLKIDAGLVKQDWRAALRRQLMFFAYQQYLHR